MNVYNNACLTPLGRAVVISRIETASCRSVGHVVANGQQSGWARICSVASEGFTTVARHRADVRA